MITTLSRLHATLVAVAPIVGVSVPTPGSVVGVRIDFDPSATQAQQTAAQTALAAFDWSLAADTTYQAQQEKVAAAASVDNGSLQVGAKVDRLTVALALVLRDEINVLRAAITHPITSITRSTTTATVTTPTAHGLSVGDAISIMGSDFAPYNIATTVATVPSGTTFTYTMANSGTTPATGSMFFTLGAVPQTGPRTMAQVVAAIKAKIAATAE